MSATASSVIVVAGSLMQPHWVPPAEVRSRLERLATLADLQAVNVELAQETGALPLELAHDRWLRQQPVIATAVGGSADAAVAPGAMSAIRRIAPLREGRELSGWQVEPAHFHLAKDHVVLMAGAAQSLTDAQAQQLAQAIEPLLSEDCMSLTVLSNELWLLDPGTQSLEIACASSEAAAGRNIEGYLPLGPDARRYRRLLNEIQMTWHEHPVNQQREQQGQLPINGVWLSGPVTSPALGAWGEALSGGRYEVDACLLDPRLRDDRHAWLDALQALDIRLHQLLTLQDPPSILLCGDEEARWLLRRPGVSGASSTWTASLRSSAAQLSRRVAALLPGQAGVKAARPPGQGPAQAAPATNDSLVRIFTESIPNNPS